jgi:hypothetical protein
MDFFSIRAIGCGPACLVLTGLPSFSNRFARQLIEESTSNETAFMERFPAAGVTAKTLAMKSSTSAMA